MTKNKLSPVHRSHRSCRTSTTANNNQSSMRDERYDRLKSANRVLYRATISMNETQRKKDKEWDKLKEEFMGRYGELLLSCC